MDCLHEYAHYAPIEIWVPTPCQCPGQQGQGGLLCCCTSQLSHKAVRHSEMTLSTYILPLSNAKSPRRHYQLTSCLSQMPNPWDDTINLHPASPKSQIPEMTLSTCIPPLPNAKSPRWNYQLASCLSQTLNPWDDTINLKMIGKLTVRQS